MTGDSIVDKWRVIRALHFEPSRAAEAINGHFMRIAESSMDSIKRVTHGVLLLSVIALYGCEDLVISDTSSLLLPTFQQSEILGFVAGFGTTFAALPDLVAMLKRRSSAGTVRAKDFSRPSAAARWDPPNRNAPHAYAGSTISASRACEESRRSGQYADSMALSPAPLSTATERTPAARLA